MADEIEEDTEAASPAARFLLWFIKRSIPDNTVPSAATDDMVDGM